MYFAAVAAEEIRRRGIVSDDADSLISHLTEARILSDDHTLRRVYRGVRDYIRRFFKPDSLETGIQFDAQSGLPSGIIGKISLNEPSSAAESIGVIALDRLIELADRAFASAGLKLWIALDRLDVAFADNLDLEQNALRALFSVYLDLRSVQSVVLKIFLRSDIWRRITKAGFREASHIVRTVTIRWNTQSLLNLVVQRALNNQVIREFYVVTPDTILGDSEQQEIFFYRVFPDKVEGGEKKPRTFDWILSHTRDSSDEVAPRELIHLLAEAQAAQLKRFETGFAEPHGEALFDRPCLKEAMLPVSKVRLEQTLLAEHPDLREIILKLEGEKTEQTLGSLSRIWDVREEEAATLAAQLVDVGFFQKPDSKENPSFWVPFLYRPGLEMVQGRAGDE